MIHCKACNDEMPLQLITDTEDPDALSHYEILCARCLGKMHQALAADEWDEILEGFWNGRHDDAFPCDYVYPVWPYHPWEFTYV